MHCPTSSDIILCHKAKVPTLYLSIKSRDNQLITPCPHSQNGNGPCPGQAHRACGNAFWLGFGQWKDSLPSVNARVLCLHLMITVHSLRNMEYKVEDSQPVAAFMRSGILSPPTPYQKIGSSKYKDVMYLPRRQSFAG
jgi:hypothetical protein